MKNIILSMLLVFMSGCAKEPDGESITIHSKERCNIPFESRLKIAVNRKGVKMPMKLDFKRQKEE